VPGRCGPASFRRPSCSISRLPRPRRRSSRWRR